MNLNMPQTLIKQGCTTHHVKIAILRASNRRLKVCTRAARRADQILPSYSSSHLDLLLLESFACFPTAATFFTPSNRSQIIPKMSSFGYDTPFIPSRPRKKRKNRPGKAEQVNHGTALERTRQELLHGDWIHKCTRRSSAISTQPCTC